MRRSKVEYSGGEVEGGGRGAIAPVDNHRVRIQRARVSEAAVKSHGATYGKLGGGRGN